MNDDDLFPDHKPVKLDIIHPSGFLIRQYRFRCYRCDGNMYPDEEIWEGDDNNYYHKECLDKYNLPHWGHDE